MIIIIKNSGQETSVDIPEGSTAGSIREYTDELEEVGAPSNYTIAVDGKGVDDNAPLQSGNVVTFRPRTNEKG